LRAAAVHLWWCYVESLSDITVFEGRCGASVHACNDVDELSATVLIIGSAARRKHALGELIDILPHPVVRFKKCLDMPPGAFDWVRMSARMHINESDRVNHIFVYVAERFNVPL
jgi:hypothetical protein